MNNHPSHISRQTDEELLATFREKGDPDCVGELFHRYTDLVYLVSMKYLKDPMEAEDMTMRIFEKLLLDLQKYEVRSFRFWLHTVVKNQCLAQIDKQKREREKQEGFYMDQREFVENGQEAHLFGELSEDELQLQHLEEALGQLQEHQRRCIALFYLEKKSYQEVSDLTGFDMKQVKSFIQNGKRNLKIHLSSIARGDTSS